MRNIFFALSFFFSIAMFGQSPDTPPIEFASRFQITNVANGTGDTLIISGYVDDCTGRFANSNISIGDSLYVLEGADLLIFGVVTNKTISLGVATFKAIDFNGAGLNPSNGQAAIFHPTTTNKLPSYVCGLRDELQQFISNRQAQMLDEIINGGGTTTGAIVGYQNTSGDTLTGGFQKIIFDVNNGNYITRNNGTATQIGMENGFNVMLSNAVTSTGGSFPVNLASGTVFSHTLTGSTATIANPTNMASGRFGIPYRIILKNASGASSTVTFSSSWNKKNKSDVGNVVVAADDSLIYNFQLERNAGTWVMTSMDDLVGSTTLASNGLTMDGDTVQLGGTLNENTTINIANKNYNVSGDNVIINIEPDATQPIKLDYIYQGNNYSTTSLAPSSTGTELQVEAGTTTAKYGKLSISGNNNQTPEVELFTRNASTNKGVFIDSTGTYITVSGSTKYPLATTTPSTTAGDTSIQVVTGNPSTAVWMDIHDIGGGGGGSESTTASNGLTLSTLDVRLGGTLTQNTTFAGAGFDWIGSAIDSFYWDVDALRVDLDGAKFLHTTGGSESLQPQGNLFFGWNTGANFNSTNHANTIVGMRGLSTAANAYSNSAFGYDVMRNAASGSSRNAVFGTAAVSLATSDVDFITAFGYHVGLNSNASDFCAIGYEALKANTASSGNTAVGQQAALSNTSGNFNSYVGYAAGSANTVNGKNTGIGYTALTNTTGEENTSLGYRALIGQSGATAAYNTAVGSSSGTQVTTGVSNVFFGRSSGAGTTTGSRNIFLGKGAGIVVTTGSDNIVISTDGTLPTGAAAGGEMNIGNSLYGNGLYSSTANIGVNKTVPLRPFHPNRLSGDETAIAYSARFESNSTGFAQVGYGTGIEFAQERANTASVVVVGTIGTPYTDTTAASVDADMVFGNIVNGTLANRMWLRGQRLGLGAAPVASAALDVNSTTGGFLAPRMTTTQRNAIASPATGLQVYNTSLNKLNVYNGSAWLAMVDSAALAGHFTSGVNTITANTTFNGAFDWRMGNTTTLDTVQIKANRIVLDAPITSVQTITASNLLDGVWAPALTNTTNVGASTPYECSYMRVGNTVTVSGRVDIDATATGTTVLEMSLPIASNFSATNKAGGTAASSINTVIPIYAEVTNDRLYFIYTASVTTNESFHFSATYRIE
jgi:hypothetical protein